MDESPEPTIILRTLKDFNQFIASRTKARETNLMSGSSRLRLNFSDVNSDCSTIYDDSKPTTAAGLNPRKRPLDNLTGLDITKRFREKDTELAEAKSTVTMLEGRLQNVDVSNKKARLESENELEKLKRKQLRDKELIDDLKHKIKRLQALQEEAQEEARKVKHDCNTSTYEAETKVLNIQREHIEPNNRLREEVSFLQQRVLDLEAEVETKTVEVESAQCHTDELLQQLDSAQHKLREATSNQHQVEMLELQVEQAKAKIKDLEKQQEDLSEAEKKNKVFQSTVAKLYNLEKENTKLKEENRFLKDTSINIKLLEEKLVNAKQRIMLLESRCEDVAHYEAKADIYKNNLKVLEEALMEELNLKDKPTVQELKSHISKLKKEDIQLTTSIEQLCASQKNVEFSQLQADNENKNLRVQLGKQVTAAQMNGQIIKRLQRKVLLLTKERDSLKQILTAYEAELTINYSTVSQERIEKVESQLELYREELKLMEEELEESYKSVVEGTETPKKRDRNERVLCMEKKLTELEEEVKRLTGANATLTQENEVLQERIENLTLKGDYDPTSTKVLHFKNNPLATAIENHETQLENLQTENEALRERIRLLKEGEEHDLTQKVGMKMSAEGHSSKDVLSLQEQISSIENRNKRLMELFKKKSLEMREAIYLLTGYRVDSPSDNQYKLSNMYSESSEDFFMFEIPPNGEIQLLETDLSNTLEEFIEIYLQRKNSFPAFLSAVTLDLFRRQSLDSPLSGVDDEDEEDDDEEEEDDDEMDDDDEDDDDDDEENINRDGEKRPQVPLPQRENIPDAHEEDEEEEEEEEEEEMDEEEEENDGDEDDDDVDDLICLD